MMDTDNESAILSSDDEFCDPATSQNDRSRFIAGTEVKLIQTAPDPRLDDTVGTLSLMSSGLWRDGDKQRQCEW